MTGARPSAFGYIATQDANETEIEEHLDHLTTYAQAHRLHLIEVYVDRRIIPGSLLRPGLEVLIRELKAYEGARVLVPTADHLSPAISVRTAIVAHLSALGAAVVVTA
ncbi:conserved hypothetical protein [Frankia canadensis]|uniref:Resolvase/invertase-type recombinase catalytic domain-containing protein n=1 Tax=Frankia canadensis TaxID=1836972 RepID=A0A2I2KTI1_9ACTN|nr:recombinase family protein [Frankia canadensis]SNQ48967.1 conserved hypothetical protein [Frankia canadensis]SOU56257.1 conserved hypothetical protein [Frankia canadensis]